jgi:hypothetical protein
MRPSTLHLLLLAITVVADCSGYSVYRQTLSPAGTVAATVDGSFQDYSRPHWLWYHEKHREWCVTLEGGIGTRTRYDTTTDAVLGWRQTDCDMA